MTVSSGPDTMANTRSLSYGRRRPGQAPAGVSYTRKQERERCPDPDEAATRGNSCAGPEGPGAMRKPATQILDLAVADHGPTTASRDSPWPAWRAPCRSSHLLSISTSRHGWRSTTRCSGRVSSPTSALCAPGCAAPRRAWTPSRPGWKPPAAGRSCTPSWRRPCSGGRCRASSPRLTPSRLPWRSSMSSAAHSALTRPRPARFIPTPPPTRAWRCSRRCISGCSASTWPTTSTATGTTAGTPGCTTSSSPCSSARTRLLRR